ncbi:MAG: YkvA family protein [Polyangiales bacterium]
MSTPTVARGQKGILAMLANPAGMWRFLRDPHTAKRTKVLAVLALVYLVSPLDAVPELLVPLFGWLDDVGVTALALTWLASKAARYENELPRPESPAIEVKPVTPSAGASPSADAASPPTPAPR